MTGWGEGEGEGAERRRGEREGRKAGGSSASEAQDELVPHRSAPVSPSPSLAKDVVGFVGINTRVWPCPCRGRLHWR